MAKQARKRTSSNTGKRTSRTPKKRGRKNTQTGKFLLPFFLSFCIVICLSALGFLGYRTVTASPFFEVTRIEVRGVHRASREEVERIVSGQTARSGVWNSDLLEIKARIERMSFIKSAAVSRVLPNGIRVSVIEREPRAIVRLSSGDTLVDEEGRLLAAADGPEPSLPFVMTGWDESKSEKADKDNLERIRTYRRMLTDWQQFDLASRVRTVNLADLREPRAVTEDSGKPVSIALGRENFGEQLKRGISAIVGKGATFEAVNLVGHNMILAPRRAE